MTDHATGDRPTGLPRGRRLGDLPEILERLPRLTSAEAEAFARDVERGRSEVGTIPRDPRED